MLWVFLSILAGFFVSLSDALNKRYLSPEGPSAMLVARTFGSFPFLFPLFLYLLWERGSFNYFNPPFLGLVALLLTLEIIATVFYMKGIKSSALSESLPFLSFTPVFILLTGYLILREKISFTGFLGIVLVVSGSYFIHLTGRFSFFTPLVKIVKEPGSRYLLSTSFIYGLTSVLGKKGLLLTDPVFFASFYFSLLGLAGLIYGQCLGKVKIGKLLQKNHLGVLLVGGTQALMCIFHMLALSLVETAYMIALKRTSILFALLLGYFFFREKHLQVRLIGAILMLSGVFMITFGRN